LRHPRHLERGKKAIDGVLESTSLQDLVERQRQKWNLKQLKDREKQCSNGSNIDLTGQMRKEMGYRREKSKMDKR